ncbi:MAG: DUF2752 domain-containing protein [Bacteroidia bacterium]|nr:DUF2752 domain-containing protein [Bacteroidia bacterium]
MSRNGLYFLILGLSLAGYVWIILNGNSTIQQNISGTNVCIFKNITGIPCPSCGTTRSVLAILKGNVIDSIGHNPLGLVMVLLLAILPIWIIIDFVFGKNSFQVFYRYVEFSLKRKYIVIPSIVIVLVVWFLNIHRHL